MRIPVHSVPPRGVLAHGTLPVNSVAAHAIVPADSLPAEVGAVTHAGVGMPIPPHGVPVHIAPAAARVPVRTNIRINGVGLFGMPRHILAEGARIIGLLLGFLLEPRGLNLGLFRVRAGPARAGFLLTRIKLNLFGLPAYFSGFLAVGLVPLLLHCPAPTARHQENNDKDHHNNANNNPNPGCNVQATHLFPFASTGP